MRIKSLDILRAFAIFGVLFRHSVIDTWYSRAGWAGVDLFFVLSGFLVSGLLFNEYSKTDHVNIKRFLIRRGFKIYPAFYVFLIVSLLTEKYVFCSVFPRQNILSEVFFLQSYFDGCWVHTWSLAIEEHFYILLSLFIFLVVHTKRLSNKSVMITFLSIAILVVFLLRFQYVYSHLDGSTIRFYKTHLRMDGLLIGVLVSYFYHFSGKIKTIIASYPIVLIVSASAFILLPFVFDAGSFLMLTFGLTAMQLGFGIVVALVVVFSEQLNKFLMPGLVVTNILSIIGRYSYSIYLWHLLLYKMLRLYLQKEPPVLIYFIVTIAGGICLSLMIEQVFLKIRDKYFSPDVVRIK